MQYLTYAEYVAGSPSPLLTEAEFDIAEFKARKTIDYWTDSRVANMQTVPESVKYCILALIKLENRVGVETQSEKPLAVSFNTDGYSESYGSASEQVSAAEKAMSKAIRQWLYGEVDDQGVPLLYRGVNGY